MIGAFEELQALHFLGPVSHGILAIAFIERLVKVDGEAL